MKTGRTVGAVSALVVALSLACGAWAAGLTATPDHKEFGVIDEGVNAVVTVVIENTGDAPVEITNVQTS
ncbi:MAG: DUF1573 domain-containing protein [Acidobacteriota bacterium]|nr:DUF1573 domain-containing protein [Acidobacteriota bacterium]